MPMNEQPEKPRFNSREIEILARLHRGETVPDRLRSAKIALMTRGFICHTYQGCGLSLSGKQVSRHLTATV